MYRSTCSWIACTAAGRPWPVFRQPSPPAKSTYSRPSTSHTRAPSARATTNGGVARPRATNRSRASSTRSVSLFCSTAICPDDNAPFVDNPPVTASAQTRASVYAELVEKNRRHLWNPFTQMKGFLEDEPLIVESAEGVVLRDVDGREYYDGNSSLWLNVHGHNRRELNEAIAAQLEKVSHSTL